MVKFMGEQGRLPYSMNMVEYRTKQHTRRAFLSLAGSSPVLLGSMAVAGQAVLSGSAIALLPDFRRSGDYDDTAALRRAIDAGVRTLRLPAGGGSGQGGQYRLSMNAAGIDGFSLPAGFNLRGDGEETLVRASRPSSGVLLDALSRDSRSQVSGIALEDFRAMGWVATHGFEEHAHLIRLNGVADAVLRNLAIEGFQGDGVYLGSGLRLGDERHNSRVSIENCRFDGLTGNNRNAISVIDCTNFVLRDCSARRTTRPGDGTGRAPTTAAQKRDRGYGVAMPGALTFEPDGVGDFSQVRNVSVEGWHVEDCGGAAVAFNLRDNRDLRVAQANFACNGVSAMRCAKGISASGYRTDGALGPVSPHNLSIAEFSASETAVPYSFNGMVGVRIQGRAVDSGTASLGMSGAANRNVAISVVHTRCGRRDAPNPGIALRVNAATDGLDISGSRFEDCGIGGVGNVDRMVYFTLGEQRNFRARNVVATRNDARWGAAEMFSRAGGSGVRFTGRPDVADIVVRGAIRNAQITP